jgi:predicted PurR-regulated permease PerM
LEKYPEKEKGDHLYSAAKGTLNLIPYVGGAVSTLFETVLSSPIDKRKEEWLKNLAATIDDLCNTVEGLKLENLANNNEFVSICIYASNIALRTHQDEKLKRILNAVRNSATGAIGDESKRMIFLRVIDEMTELHIRVFIFLAEIERFVKELDSKQPRSHTTNWGDARNVWDETYNDIRSQDHMLNVIVADLNRYGFVRIKEFHEARLDSVATQFGLEFNKFIKSKS